MTEIGGDETKVQADSPETDVVRYVLRLFITGQTTRSLRALENIQKICEEHLNGRYQLDVVDIYKEPQFAAEAQIIASPTVVKMLPPPLRRIIGDLSNEEKVLVGLDLMAKPYDSQ